MAEQKYTIFQRLGKVLSDVNSDDTLNTLNIHQDNDVIAVAKTQEEYNQKLLQAKQQAFLGKQWVRSNYGLSKDTLQKLNAVQLMYREADNMDLWPEFGTSLDIMTEEACHIKDGALVNVYSQSNRIKGVLEDLFVNRLALHTTLPMVCRSTCKYGNTFMLLNVDGKNGILGWKQLPVYEMERWENGVRNEFSALNAVNLEEINGGKIQDTQFIWVGDTNGYIPYKNWQIAHFRLLYDSIFLPYGVSVFNKARRHFRLLSMMEDTMLIYRLDRSVERRVFKINVGNINEDDVQAYVQSVANEFKRKEIIDPQTGQLDLRKSFMPVWKDTPIPLLDGRTITIEDLAKEYENGKVNYVYSIQDKTLNVVAGKVVWCGKNYTANKMVKITLDDGTFMSMAGEHEVVLRDGTKKRADKLTEGDSIMPFYYKNQPLSKRFKSDYQTVFNPNSGKYEFTHRLISKELQKKKNDTVVHHINFNRYDNTPNNLQWMSWKDHKDLHIKFNTHPLVRKQRSLHKKKMWSDATNHKKYCENMKVKFDHYVWDEIEIAIQEGYIYSQKTLVDYINTNLIDYLISINKSNKLKNFKSISKQLVRSRIQELGFLDCSDYLQTMEKTYGLTTHYERLNKDKSERAKKYNFQNNFKGIKPTTNDNNIKFNEDIWRTLRTKVIKRELNSGSDILDYINDYLLNDICRVNNTSISEITYSMLLRIIRRKGYYGFSDYVRNMRKNHKVKKIEYINGDDVYCMSVVGLNGESDRHNFALKTINENGTWSNSGCFVSNSATEDFFIPVRDENSPSPIETLQAAQNLTAIDDIKFIQNKIFTALRIPKSFLNFDSTAGDGKNLSLMDVRFTRTVNRIQQALLMELNKIAVIHLYLCGFQDELTNFTLSMNNPSAQAEMLELENLAKKITTAKDAVSDPGGGIPLTSMNWAWKNIFKWSDKDISKNIEELRLENALAHELNKTNQIIKRTGLFDTVDNIYGEAGAEYSEDENTDMSNDDSNFGGGGGGSLSSFGGGDFDLSSGSEGEMDMDTAADEEGSTTDDTTDTNDSNDTVPNIADALLRKTKSKLLNEKKEYEKRQKEKIKRYNEMYQQRLKEEQSFKKVPIYNKAFFINEEMDKIKKQLEDFEMNDTK